MIWSYPRVRVNGDLTGGEVSFRFKDIIAIEPLHQFRYISETREDEEILVPGCCSICIGRHEFNIKANYDELKALFKQLTELYG